MATILKARGRMTQDLATQYEVGQEVVLVNPLFDDPDLVERFPVGAAGVVRKVVISDPGDGDATLPMFYIRVGRHTSLFGSDEIAPAAEAEA